ncbi:MAG: helix-turn-helix domain-containing protein [Burkholderiales bacterium]|nr:helix-turn-helix domain-containing protein [Burkholderiales bacterium]
MDSAIQRALALTATSRALPQQPLIKRQHAAAATRLTAQENPAAFGGPPGASPKPSDQDTSALHLLASDIVRFRPKGKGTIDRRIRIDYLTDPEHPQSVLLRLTPASAAGVSATPAAQDLLTSQQAADLLNVSRPYLNKLVDSNTFTGVMRTAAGHRRIPRAEVERVHAEMRAVRRSALDDMLASTSDLRTRELEAARAKATRRWVASQK